MAEYLYVIFTFTIMNCAKSCISSLLEIILEAKVLLSWAQYSLPLCPETETGSIYWDQLSTFHLITERECNHKDVRFEVSTAATRNAVFWEVTLCGVTYQKTIFSIITETLF
jgi:hypothetical protein